MVTSKNRYCLAIDQGTFSSRAILFNQNGGVVYSAQQALSLDRQDENHIEQDADDLLESVRHVIRQVFTHSGIQPEYIKTAGLSTQRSSIVAWRPSTGEAITPVLSWQDTRAAGWMDKFIRHRDFIQRKTGLYPNAHYGASKIHWLLNRNDAVRSALKQNDCAITPLASFILFNITDNQAINIDIANAARTLLCNLLKKDWDRELLELFTIQKELLPDCRPVIYDYGRIKSSGINITAVNGDQTAALYSNGVPDESVLKVNLGTGAFVLTAFDEQQLETPAFARSNLLAGIAYNDTDSAQYYIEGTVNGAGAAVQWIQEKLQIKDIGAILPQPDSKNADSFIFINSIGGVGSPVWRSDIAPCFIDEKNNVQALNPQQSIVAVLESIVFLLMINITAILKLKNSIRNIEISGGLSNIDFLCQALANLTRLSVQRPEDTEATARGICWLALADRSHWEKTGVAKEFKVSADAGLEARFNHFKLYLKEKYAVSIPR